MFKSPIPASSARKRKGLPRKAPVRGSSKAAVQSSTLSTSGALLLLAFLREGSRQDSFDNTRFRSPTTPRAAAADFGAKRRRAERDLLPAPEAGYGRGKRSASAAINASAEAGPSSISGPDSSKIAQSTSTAVPAIRKGNNATGFNGRRPKRAVSVDTAAGDNKHLTLSPPRSVGAGEHAELTTTARALRASSTGLSSFHYGNGHHALPSPLARSFSSGGEEQPRSGEAGGVMSGAIKEREGRRLDAPHHLQ
ncbi:hypothetical protein P7C70_g2401, partial [Phenoliferia sp. Uapishka_3]